MEVIFTPAAQDELADAQDWYEIRQAGLGTIFREQDGTTVVRLRENPYQFPMVFRNVHRARLRKFSYALFFWIETDTIVVIACFHGSRDPKRWERRM